jgi:hypothetical protein
MSRSDLTELLGIEPEAGLEPATLRFRIRAFNCLRATRSTRDISISGTHFVCYIGNFSLVYRCGENVKLVGIIIFELLLLG